MDENGDDVAARSPDERLLALAATQLGAFTITQAIACGVTRATLRVRLQRKLLVREHRGVFSIAGHPRSAGLPHLAAVLAAGGSARASHRAAAWGWEMTPFQQLPEITTTGDRRVDIPGVRTHRTTAKLLPPVNVKGVPMTTAAETLLDIGAVRGIDDVRNALDRAIGNRTLTPMDALRELDRRGGAGIRGSAHLRALLDEAGISGSHPPSVLEAKMRRLIHRAGLPQPECEKIVGPNGEYRLDFPWPEVMLVAEVSGWLYHSSFAAFHRGMSRQNTLTLEGYGFLNYSWKHVTKSPRDVVKELTEGYAARLRFTSGGLWLPDDHKAPKVRRRAG